MSFIRKKNFFRLNKIETFFLDICFDGRLYFCNFRLYSIYIGHLQPSLCCFVFNQIWGMLKKNKHSNFERPPPPNPAKN